MKSFLRLRSWLSLLAAAVLAGCATEERRPEPPLQPAQVRAQITSLLPAPAADREGWAVDIYAAFSSLGIAPTLPNICAVIAVTEQESSFRVDPAVPGLGRIAQAEIDRRAERAGVPKLAVELALKLRSPDGTSYGERIAAARTERELSRIFEDFIGMVPLGKRLFADWNPVRTGGPMQVSIAFAEAHAGQRGYPYPVAGSIRHEVFTRRGGMYFGIAHLLDYPAAYDRHLYRFADFNAGQYASRNAAFQRAVSAASGIPLALDGDLVRRGSDADAKPGSTELAVRSLARQLGMNNGEIRRALEQDMSAGFERSALYRQVFELADRLERRPQPRAVLPDIALQGPKITRKLTTEWFAKRVEQRQHRCLERAAGL
jgi:hypothetical protein